MVEDTDDAKSELSYVEEDETLRAEEPPRVLPAISGQCYRPSRGLPLSRRVYPSLSPSGPGPTCSPTKICSQRVGFAKVVTGLKSTRK